MPEEFDEIEDVLNSFEAVDIKNASKFEGGDIAGHGSINSEAAFNNPGSGTRQVTTSIVDGGDVSMKSHYIEGGGMAEWDDENGNTHSGPKFVPGEKRKRQKSGLPSKKLKAMLLKVDTLGGIIRHLMKDGMNKLDVNVFVPDPARFAEYAAFRCDGGMFKNQVVYIVGRVLWGELDRDYMLSDGDLFAALASEEGWVRGGTYVDVKYLDTVIYSLMSRIMQERRS